MPEDKSLFDRLRERGDEVLQQITGELSQNPQFIKAMEGAMRGKQKLDQVAANAMKSMNIPSRTEFKRAVARIESLEEEVTSLKEKLARARRRAAPGRSSTRSVKAASGPRKARS
jgi:hypothetical protein